MQKNNNTILDVDDLIGNLFFSHLSGDKWKNIPEKMRDEVVSRIVRQVQLGQGRGGFNMSRKRVIDTGIYFDTEICAILGERGLHLYIRLWGISDDSGVYLPNYGDISLQMGALRFTEEEAKNFIEALIKSEKVIPFTSTGKTYHWLKNFLKHQPLNNPAIPRYPLPEWISMEVKKYGSGKKFAKFSIIKDKLPVAYHDCIGNVPLFEQEVDEQLPTSSLPVDEKSVETETKQKRNETETKRKETQGSVEDPYITLMDWLWSTYPHRNGEKKGKKPTENNLRKYVKLSEFEDFKKAVMSLKNSPDVKRGFSIKDPERFIYSKQDKYEPWREVISQTGGNNAGQTGQKQVGPGNTSTGERTTQDQTSGGKAAPGKYAGLGEEITIE